MMRNFESHIPTKWIFGKGQIEKIKSEIPKYGKRVLVTYGGGSVKKNGVYDDVMSNLKEIGAEIFELGGIEPNPRVTSAKAGIEIIKREKIDFILAIGGGSTIDCTKLMAAGAFYEGDAWDIVIGKHSPTTSLPFGTVLTIPATGSEMNSGSVITNWETNEKYGWGTVHTFPKFSICDPTYTISLPLNQTIYGMVDMMAHVFELYFHHGTNQPLVDRMGESVLKTVIETAPKLIKQLDCYDCRETIMYCGTIALNGYLKTGIVGDWATHHIEHAVSAVHDIPHGAGLAILFPNWMKHVLPENVARFKHYAESVFGINPTGKTDEEVAVEGINATREFWNMIGAPSRLADFSIGEADIDLMVEKAMSNGPFGQFKKLAAEDIRAIFVSSL